jgi:GntR family transcriptional regulator
VAGAGLDRASVIPLYYQIRQRLLRQIRQGVLKPGQPLPSEQDISGRFGVSRMTARQALKGLCDDGIAYSRRGRGTFVADSKQEISISQLLSFTQEMKSRGAAPSSRVLSFATGVANPEETRALQLTRGEKVFRLRRVRQADSVPMGVENSCLPYRLCPDLQKTLVPRASLYETLARHYGVHLGEATEVVEAGLASPQAARWLQITQGSPVFLFTRICYLKSGQPVEYVRSVYRGDRYKIVSRLTAQPNQVTRRC